MLHKIYNNRIIFHFFAVQRSVTVQTLKIYLLVIIFFSPCFLSSAVEIEKVRAYKRNVFRMKDTNNSKAKIKINHRNAYFVRKMYSYYHN